MNVYPSNDGKDQFRNPKGVVLHASKQNQSVNFRVEIKSGELTKPTSTLTVKNVTANGNEVVDSLFCIE